MLGLHRICPSSVTLASIEILRVDSHYFVRSTSTDGAVGIANANDRFAYVWPIAKQLVIPYFIGKDARDLESLVVDVPTGPGLGVEYDPAIWKKAEVI
jgi:L-alanine-DL-glutamate epimerase-like enolase superfamily enzyme